MATKALSVLNKKFFIGNADSPVEIRAFKPSSEMAYKRKSEASLSWLEIDLRTLSLTCITSCPVRTTKFRTDQCCGHTKINYLGLLGTQSWNNATKQGFGGIRAKLF
jgi:hypothetical protein